MDLSKIAGLKKNNPAGAEEINLVESELGLVLPKVYRALLGTTNGFINDEGIGLYGTDNLVERNQTLEVKEYAKGYVAIGDDSGDKVFLVKSESGAKEVIAVDCGYMNPEDGPEMIAADFEQWISGGCIITTSKFEGAKSSIEPHDIILERAPVGGIKDLLTIKKVLQTDISIGELLSGSKQPPCIVMRNVPYAKAVIRIKKLGPLGEILRLEPINIP